MGSVASQIEFVCEEVPSDVEEDSGVFYKSLLMPWQKHIHAYACLPLAACLPGAGAGACAGCCVLVAEPDAGAGCCVLVAEADACAGCGVLVAEADACAGCGCASCWCSMLVLVVAC